ncbi:MAG: 2-amino-4-hydroxy-6-hydroxymethyldihydropteridine diphosphokinase [Gammaproteobacteria bacterium]|nr:2-amino-4-hydroxy-6-hydroxymethyldihydropteridine diphosphokinase [Gammaproteobacteria bacterium]
MLGETWFPAYIGLGSNLDEPRGQVETAMASLATIADTSLVMASPLYGSAPMGPVEQPDYVNAVAAVLTRSGPQALMRALLAIEEAQGRVRGQRKWGPRRIDLDLLLHGDNVCDGETLSLPHPGLCERCFVLRPLADLAPALRIPDGRQVAQLLNTVDCSRLWPL